MKTKPLDLKQEYPRSPREKIGGYVHLARMLDKARAKGAGRLGEYIYACPLDESLLEFLGVSEEAFYEVTQEREDHEVLDWIKEKAIPRAPAEIEEWNRAFLKRKPRNEESLKRFLEKRNQLAPHRTDITAWPDLLDLEEGREVPERTPAS